MGLTPIKMISDNVKMDTEKQQFKREFTKRLISFSVNIFKFCEKLDDRRAFRSLCDQIIRSSSSVGANVVEAKSSSSRRDYIKFFEIALKSANETQYWLMVFKELVGQNSELDILLAETIEITKILASSVLTLKGKK